MKNSQCPFQKFAFILFLLTGKNVITSQHWSMGWHLGTTNRIRPFWPEISLLLPPYPLSTLAPLARSRELVSLDLLLRSSCPLVSHWIWSMGGTSRRLEGGWNGVEYIWVCDSLPGGTQVSGGYIFLWWGIAPVRWSSPKATGFVFFFLTFGNTSSICPFIERVVSTSYCCRKSFVTCGFSSACHFFIYHPPSASHLFLAMTLTRTATQYLWSLWQLSDIDR